MLLSTEPGTTQDGGDQLSKNADLHSEGGTDPTREDIFEVLANERRRHVLDYLKQTENGRVDQRTLVTEVAARENEIEPREVSSNQRKSVYVGLRQTHLPKMDRCGIISYDSNRGEIELTDAADRAQFYLEYVPENDIPWAYHYFGLSVLFTALTGLTWLEMFPFAGLDGLAVSALIVATFALSALVHSVYTHRHRIGHSS